jgi:hypothetical protein
VKFAHSITSEVIELLIGAGHLRSQEIAMHRKSPFPPVADLTMWLLNLATRLLARGLNMPEPLVHDTGMFVYIRVQEVETSIGRSLCPIRLWRRVQKWYRR